MFDICRAIVQYSVTKLRKGALADELGIKYTLVLVHKTLFLKMGYILVRFYDVYTPMPPITVVLSKQLTWIGSANILFQYFLNYGSSFLLKLILLQSGYKSFPGYRSLRCVSLS